MKFTIVSYDKIGLKKGYYLIAVGLIIPFILFLDLLKDPFPIILCITCIFIIFVGIFKVSNIKSNFKKAGYISFNDEIFINDGINEYKLLYKDFATQFSEDGYEGKNNFSLTTTVGSATRSDGINKIILQGKEKRYEFEIFIKNEKDYNFLLKILAEKFIK